MDANVINIVAEVKAIDVEIARLQAERSTRIDAIKQSSTGVIGKVDFGNGLSFTIRANNAYDESVMRANLLPGQIRRCTVPKLDKAAVKRLYPAVYDMAKVERGISVTIG